MPAGQLASTLPPYTLRCHINTLLAQGKAKEVLEFIKKYMVDFYERCRPAVRSSILSLQFVRHLRASEHLQAISLVQKSELKKEPFPSVSETGKPILCCAEDLTKLFCKSSLDEGQPECFLASKRHRDAVISFVNRELLQYEKAVKEKRSEP